MKSVTVPGFQQKHSISTVFFYAFVVLNRHLMSQSNLRAGGRHVE
jgi:hypothetical protein